LVFTKYLSKIPWSIWEVFKIKISVLKKMSIY
jgi:hypothetical protein